MKELTSRFFSFWRRYGFVITAGLVMLLLVFIRLNNWLRYNTWWADDGGAHVAYVKAILEHGRLPTMAETYVAWHEPFYYLLMAGWDKLTIFVPLKEIDRWEFFNVGVSFLFLWLVWKFSLALTQKNHWLSLLLTAALGVLFTNVKLASYVNNELLVQTLMLLLAWVFLRFRLADPGRFRHVLLWSLMLSLALWVKMTAAIVLIAALLTWLILFVWQRQEFFLKYALLTFVVSATCYAPWLIYKQAHFGPALSTNIYQETDRQPVLGSPSWAYLIALNPRMLIDSPMWRSQPDSFFGILLSDTFGDHYNLFVHVDEVKALASKQQVLVTNGRFTTPEHLRSLLWTNRIGLVIALIWIIGLAGWLVQGIKQRSFVPTDVFFLLAIFGGIGALVYHNLAFPYLEKGVLKAMYLAFGLPIIAVVASRWWWSKLNQPSWRFAVLVLPWVAYLIAAWPQLLV